VFLLCTRELVDTMPHHADVIKVRDPSLGRISQNAFRGIIFCFEGVLVVDPISKR